MTESLHNELRALCERMKRDGLDHGRGAVLRFSEELRAILARHESQAAASFA